jgi:hypothetical protein
MNSLNWLKVRHTSYGYGFFPGGDPRLFEPDPDSTPEELENHRLACEAWNRGECTSAPDGQWVGKVHLLRCQFGLGSYSWTEDLWLWDWLRFEWWPYLHNRLWFRWHMSWLGKVLGR